MINEFLSKTNQLNPLKNLSNFNNEMPLRDIGINMRNMLDNRFVSTDNDLIFDIFIVDDIASYFNLKLDELKLLMSIIIQPIFDIVSLESILDKSIYNKLIEQEIIDNLMSLPREKVSLIFEIGQKLISSKENFILNDLMNGEPSGSKYFSVLDGIIKRIPSLLPQFIENKLNLIHESMFGFISVIENILEAKIKLTNFIPGGETINELQILKIFKTLELNNDYESPAKMKIFMNNDYFNSVSESKSMLISRLNGENRMMKPLTSDIVLNFIDMLVTNTMDIPISLVELMQALSVDVTTSFLIMLNLVEEGYFEITDIMYNMAKIFPDKFSDIISNKEKFLNGDLLKFTNFEDSVLLDVIFKNIEKISSIHREYTELMGLPLLSLSEFITMANPKVSNIITQKKQSLLSLTRAPLDIINPENRDGTFIDSLF